MKKTLLDVMYIPCQSLYTRIKYYLVSDSPGEFLCHRGVIDFVACLP